METIGTFSYEGLISDQHPTVAIPVTLAITASALKRGTLMGKVTATGHYKPYSSSASDGSQNLENLGILVADVPASASTQPAQIFVHGVFDPRVCETASGLTADSFTAQVANGLVFKQARD